MKYPSFPQLANFPDGADLFKALRDAPPVDAQAISETIERALASAGLDTHSGPLKTMQDHLRRTLAGLPAGLAAEHGAADVIDVEARVVGQAEPAAPPTTGGFTAHTFAQGGASRRYKLYVPRSAAEQAGPLPLVVMLHGCTQSADDFAAGTRMNQLAEQHGLLVAYPEQGAKANGSRCWNWFKPGDQRRDKGEPALIAGIVREIAAGHEVDPQRIFVAGLSAGAAMAVILGETYPELFAAVGVHSGLPYGSARDVPSALAAMKGGGSAVGVAGATVGLAPAPATALRHAVPTIVFHGDQDSTVDRRNGADVLAQALVAARTQRGPLALSEEAGQAPGGRGYRRTVHRDAAGRPLLEDWLLHGAGHAWSGGSASGSFTDPAGPDASAAMLHFFLAQSGREKS